jgi:GTPase
VADGYRCGHVAVVGRPNVGKSTLVNALVGHKVSIVSPRPQTTRHRILGILTRPDAQVVFIDLPGIHIAGRKAMNRYLNRAALASVAGADTMLFVVEALRFKEEDARALAAIVNVGRPVIAIVNKVDRVVPKSRLLPYIDELRGRADFAGIVPMSALKRQNLDGLVDLLVQYLPESPPLYPTDRVTDRDERFQAAEIIREKLTWRLRQELPYGLAVEIERYERDADGRITIGAIVWVERTGHKAIVIGQGGAGLKAVGRAARLELVRLSGVPVHLELWVKVKENWSDSEAALRQFGYDT